MENRGTGSSLCSRSTEHVRLNIEPGRRPPRPPWRPRRRPQAKPLTLANAPAARGRAEATEKLPRAANGRRTRSSMPGLIPPARARSSRLRCACHNDAEHRREPVALPVIRIRTSEHPVPAQTPSAGATGPGDAGTALPELAQVRVIHRDDVVETLKILRRHRAERCPLCRFRAAGPPGSSIGGSPACQPLVPRINLIVRRKPAIRHELPNTPSAVGDRRYSPDTQRTRLIAKETLFGRAPAPPEATVIIVPAPGPRVEPAAPFAGARQCYQGAAEGRSMKSQNAPKPPRALPIAGTVGLTMVACCLGGLWADLDRYRRGRLLLGVIGSVAAGALATGLLLYWNIPPWKPWFDSTSHRQIHTPSHGHRRRPLASEYSAASGLLMGGQ